MNSVLQVQRSDMIWLAAIDKGSVEDKETTGTHNSGTFVSQYAGWYKNNFVQLLLMIFLVVVRVDH